MAPTYGGQSKHGYFQKVKLLLMVRSVVHESKRACVAVPGADNNILRTVWYIRTYESCTLLPIHNNVLLIFMDPVRFFSKRSIFFIFSYSSKVISKFYSIENSKNFQQDIFSPQKKTQRKNLIKYN